MRRGPTSRSELQISWQFPVFTTSATPVSDGSAAGAAKRALSMEEAFAEVAGDDPRPLLVLRECLTCTGTDDALLTREADNEKTMLMSRWFHCVKLPPSVLEGDHPFHAMFKGEEPSHLFVATRDGTLRHDLKGDQSRTELWGDMEKVLAATYAEKHAKALKKLQKLLNEFDEADLRIAQLDGKLTQRLEKDGPNSSKVRKLRKELVELEEERAELRSELREAAALELTKPEERHAALPKGGDSAS